MNYIKKSLTALMAVAICMTMASCSAGGGSSDSILFGALPGVIQEYQAQKDKLEEKAKDIKTDEEKAKLIKESEKLKEKWTPKIEEAAKALDGKPIDVTDGDFTVTSPVSISLKSLGNGSPVFSVAGEVKAAKDLTGSTSYYYQPDVYIAGYDDAGNQLFKNKIGYAKAQEDKNTRGLAVVVEGTPVTLTQLNYRLPDTKSYEEAKVLKFILN